MASSTVGRGQALIDTELYTICTNLTKKFDEIKAGKKAPLIEDLKDAVRLLLYGAKPDALHPSFKENIFDFLVHISTFSDVLAAQNGVSTKNKILITLLLRLLYTTPNESKSLTDAKLRRSFNFLFSVFQRGLSSGPDDDDTDVPSPLTLAVFQALDVQTGVPRQSILRLPTILLNRNPLKIEQAGEITKNLCNWLLVYISQNPGSSGKKTLFQSKNTLSPVQQSIVTELDGTTSRDLFTVLNNCKSYHKEHILNVYTFSVLKPWLHYAFSQSDVNELLTSVNSRLGLRGKDISHSGSPMSSFGGSRFYDDFSSESDSAGTPSVSSSLACSPSFSNMEDLTAADQSFDRRRISEASHLTTPAMLPFRKASQAFDTISITSDVFSNTSNLRSVAARYCLRIINQSERIPQKDVDRGIITASVVEAIEILDMLCEEDSSITQKVFIEIKRLYKRIEEKPISTRRVFVSLVQFYIHHHEEMLVQIDDVLETYFREIPAQCYSIQPAGFELFELCLNNAQFFKDKNATVAKYFPNVFKFIAWWPCTIFEEASEFLEIIVNEATAAEILHLILDLPCLSAALQMEHKSILKNNDKLEAALGTPIRPYYKAMFAFVLRQRSDGAETIDKLSELHKLLSVYESNALVTYVADLIPSLLLTYFAAIDDLENKDIYKKIFPIIIERTFQLYPNGKDHHQEEVLEIFANEIQVITKAFPDVVGQYMEEVMAFVAHVQDKNPTFPAIIASVLHGIGSGVSHIPPTDLQSAYETLETLIYEAAQNFGSKESQILSPLLDLEVVQSLISTVTKLAAHNQELLQRAIVCLNKIATLNVSSALQDFSTVKLYARELMNVLRKPQVAPTILCDTNRSVPWHLHADVSLMMKVHILSEQVNVM